MRLKPDVLSVDGAEPELLNADELAALLRINRPRAYELMRENKIAGVVRLGRQVRVLRSELQRFLESGGRGLSTEER